MAENLALLGAILLVAAMVPTSIRLLRWIALAAGGAAIAYFSLGDVEGPWVWLAGAFLLINGAQLARLHLRIRTHALREEERELLEHVLKVEEPDRQRRLRDLLEWRDAPVGEVLMRQGERGPPLIYVASGTGRIEVGGSMVGTCTKGDFLGEMSAILGDDATATVVVAESMRIARFDRDALAEMTRTMPELQRAFDHALNRGLAAKIVRMNANAAQDA
ncbi:Crp/Fnr family transcriptional regulator [Parerythrobacter lacustris]|uniref:Cyclic nucleotide-binding domain-containing protein n=1 Tax=Parerythrobacter lacustris TaxID=2969984 RepID=A0ABT1XP79_9SPHN|nr:cyclic nucleotide-binding domain-containing protein [Parerythrobacter lacustris]MCR2833456.1 cyclic nucleotide-binding domain-containing protein [Parerythrobacter lacustris]